MASSLYTSKDFCLVARVANSMDDMYVRREMAEAFAEEFVRRNPRFDKEKFRRACGLVFKLKCQKVKL